MSDKKHNPISSCAANHLIDTVMNADLGFSERQKTALNNLRNVIHGDSKRVDVLREINAERNRQHSIYGEQNHTPAEWLAILGEEFGEVCKAVYEARHSAGNLDNYREELVQVAAVAVQMIECYDRNKGVQVEPVNIEHPAK